MATLRANYCSSKQISYTYIQGISYTFDAQGNVNIDDTFFEIDGQTYYLNANGVPTTGWAEIDGIQRYFAENGTLYTAIPFFTESAHTPLTAKEIEEMPDEEFAARAYSWRGKPTVLRNLKYLEEENA